MVEEDGWDCLGVSLCGREYFTLKESVGVFPY